MRKIKAILRGTILAVLAAAGTAAMAFPASAEETMGAVYGVHSYGKGWAETVEDNVYESAANGSYVTAITASLKNQPAGMTGTISYQVNVSGFGWQEWKENFTPAGTTDTDRPLEAVRMQLTGQLEENYDLYYSVFQSGSWTELVKNGETAGTEAQGLRVDGLRVAVMPKNGGLPAEGKHKGRQIDPSRPMVALTFDDGPSGQTARILDCLESNGAVATFFMVGNRMGKYPETIKRMVALGCEPASHTWDHSYISKLSSSALLNNLNQVDAALQEIAGVKTIIMRPPGGFINDASKQTLAQKGVPAILWSIDTLDWKTRNAQNTINTVLGSVRGGDIVLMHDLYEASADAALVLIPELIHRGYQLVTVSEMAALRGGAQPGVSYHSFRP